MDIEFNDGQHRDFLVLFFNPLKKKKPKSITTKTKKKSKIEEGGVEKGKSHLLMNLVAPRRRRLLRANEVGFSFLTGRREGHGSGGARGGRKSRRDGLIRFQSFGWIRGLIGRYGSRFSKTPSREDAEVALPGLQLWFDSEHPGEIAENVGDLMLVGS